MDFYQENRVFLQRGGKLLLFNAQDGYDGDSVNIEDYVERGDLRYILIKHKGETIKQINCYFCNTTDQHLTQYGEWTYIEDVIKLPTTEFVGIALKNYYKEGRFDNEVRVITKNSEGMVTITVCP